MEQFIDTMQQSAAWRLSHSTHFQIHSEQTKTIDENNTETAIWNVRIGAMDSKQIENKRN